MSEMTVNMTADAQAAAQQSPGVQVDRTEVRRMPGPRTDVLDIENVSGIDLNTARFRVSNQSGMIRLQNERTAIIQSYREETVIDFAQGTVSQHVSGDLSYIPQDEDTGAFWRDDATVRITFSASSYCSGQLEDVIRQLIADHKERRSALEAYFTGAEREEILSGLDELYQQGQNAVAHSFANMVNCFWECRGQGGPEQRERVQGSVEALFVSFERKSVQAEQDGLLTLQELDFAALSISAALRSANLPSGHAQGVQRYQSAAAMQNIPLSHLIGQG